MRAPRLKIATLLAIFFAAAFWRSSALAQGAEIVRESVYNYIIVARENSVVSFRRMENQASLSAVDLARPSFQIFHYGRFLFAPALLEPNPENVLSIGLGAGSFNRLFNLLYPAATLTTVEIDPMILNLAVEFADFRSSPRNIVAIEDGRRFLSRSKQRWNWIVVDAFIRNSQYPQHLATREFFDLTASRLEPGGLLVVNMDRLSKLYECLITTIKAVYPNVVLLEVAEGGNAVIVASMTPSPPLRDSLANASLRPFPILTENGIDLSEFQTSASTPAPNNCPQALTDDFAPTEYLGLERRK